MNLNLAHHCRTDMDETDWQRVPEVKGHREATLLLNDRVYADVQLA